MTEREREPYRPYMVSYDGFRCINHMSLDETEAHIKQGDIDWILHHTQYLEGLDLMVYKAYLEVRDAETSEGSPSNVSIAEKLNETLEPDDQISRGAVARARKKIGHVMDFKPGW